MSTYRNDVTGNDEHAIVGASPNGRGVVGWSETQYGVSGDSKKSAGVRGTSVDGRGTEGWSTNSEGVVGISTNGTGVWGQNEKAGTGVFGTSDSGYGMHGISKNSAGVRGTSEAGRGVEGWATTSEGVVGLSKSGSGVWGQTDSGTGVLGSSKTGVGIHGKGGKLAGFFEGDVEVTGDLRLVNADCAEDFAMPAGETIEPGTVMVLGDENCLRPSQRAYDTRVAGVISGGGTYKPGIILDSQSSEPNRLPVALLGKVFCKVDAQFGAIAVGDLLTTSATPGHAMKIGDPQQSFGAVIGKALRPLTAGRGLIPILISLQ